MCVGELCMCVCVCVCAACVRACGGVVKKCLTTEQKFPGSRPTMHVCVCVCIIMYRPQCVFFH